MKKAFLSLLLCPILLLCGCSEPPAPRSVDGDVMHLAAIMEAEGYTTQYYEEGHSALAAIADEMATNTKAVMKGAITGYLYVQNGSSGACVAEVFVFEQPQDAKVFYDYMQETGSFTKDESECRIDVTVVYMGYIKDLDLLEGSAPQ